MVEGALGRRAPAVGRKRPDSAAWAARKRNSIDCAFSELRAMVDEGGGKYWCSARDLDGFNEAKLDPTEMARWRVQAFGEDSSL